MTYTLKSGQIDVVISMPLSFQNQTSGLMGVFNNDQEDDLTSPDGAVLPVNATERDIYYQFGEKCTVGLVIFRIKQIIRYVNHIL